MTKDLVIRGVPRALIVDMWWLASDTDRSPPLSERPRWSGADRWGRPVAALAGLTALADLLFYGHAPGLSLAVFAVAIFAVAAKLRGTRDVLRPALLLTGTALPVVEHVQALSVAFLAIGLLASLVWVTTGPNALGRGMAALAASVPLRGLVDALRASREVAGQVRSHGEPGALKSWLFPLGGGLVLTVLLAEANPLLSRALTDLLSFRFASEDTVLRLMFWVGTGLMIWPLIAAPRPLVTRDLPVFRLPGFGLTAASVTKALVLFNLILGVQTLLDAVYLWGGATLPRGLSPAEYAHRGAYPLLATALLAGGFALASRPFTAESRRLRALVLLWIGQNVALTLSALLRLDLYVDVFGLTYLRLYAAIWMGLVATGLALTGWQIWRERSNLWLVVRCAALGVAVLYAACFMNFASLIASVNLSRPGGHDGNYICSLGPTAAAAIAASGVEPIWLSEYGEVTGKCRIDAPQIEGWRDWGFRTWRVRHYLEEMPGRS
jgi:hypothetical protein